jgi:hypothetical protein
MSDIRNDTGPAPYVHGDFWLLPAMARRYREALKAELAATQATAVADRA